MYWGPNIRELGQLLNSFHPFVTSREQEKADKKLNCLFFQPSLMKYAYKKPFRLNT